MASTILVTGGTGFIGSHTCVALQQAGYRVLVLDNLSSSTMAVLDAIAAITGTRPEFMLGDVRDAESLHTVFKRNDIIAVLHFAGLKAVGESTRLPVSYYDNNVHGSVQLLEAMQYAGVRN